MKIGVNGAGGRMGKLIIEEILSNPDTEVACAVDVPTHPFINKPIVADVILSSTPMPADVYIDFSSDNGTKNILEFCKQKNIPLVIGTTALSETTLNTIKTYSQYIPILQAPNMSIGINLLLEICPIIANKLGDADIEIVEKHHKHKKDAPSGTALAIAKSIREEKNFIYGRKGISEVRPSNIIGIHAVRGGDIVGEHTILYCMEGETIEITHRAHSRKTFAKGAVKAAIFLYNKKSPGLYTMKDVLAL